jgi:moderate conductance mechanosensitive channel
MPDATTYLTMIPLAAGALAAAIAVWLMLRVATRAIDKFAARHEHAGLFEEAAAFAKRLTRFVRSTLWFIAFLAASLVMLRGLGFRGTPRLSVEEFVAWLLGPGLRLIVIATSAYLIARGTHFLIDSLQIFLVSRDASEMGLLERKKRIQTLGQLLRVVATLLVVGVAGLMTLSLFNVDIRPILTGAGIAGLAVGFGAQNLVRDVIAGFFLILEDQVRLGDVVSINGKSGLVEAIRLRTIALRSQDGTVHVIPNGVINELSNMTKDYSYAVLDIGIPYEESVDRVEAILRSVAEELRSDPVHGPNILEPLEVVGVEAFGESAIQFRIRIKTVPIQQWGVGRELRRRIKTAFEKRGVQFPPRPVTVRLKTAIVSTQDEEDTPTAEKV